MQSLSPVKGQASAFDILPTPDPGTFSFRVSTDAVNFNPVTMVPAGTTYASCGFLSQRGRMGFENFQNYVYTHATRDGGKLWFHFGKKLTPAERSRPFRTFYTNRNYPWPAVLEDMYFVETRFPQSSWDGQKTITAPTLLPRYRYRPSVNVDSLCQVQQFLDAVPWDQAQMIHEQPIPTDVNATYLGVSVDFPRCLHQALEFKELLPGASVPFGVGMIVPPPGRDPSKMQFPKTNFTDWTPFVIEDRQETVGGLFLREVITIFPPTPPKIVSQ